MSKRQVRGRNRMPDYWEWSCDLCGKVAHTNASATRPAGWVPKGRTAGSSHDFCSPEHEVEFDSNRAAIATAAEGSPEKPAPEADEAKS